MNEKSRGQPFTINNASQRFKLHRALQSNLFFHATLPAGFYLALGGPGLGPAPGRARRRGTGGERGGVAERRMPKVRVQCLWRTEQRVRTKRHFRPMKAGENN